MVVTIPIYLTDGPVDTKVEVQIRTVAMDFWQVWSIRFTTSLKQCAAYLQQE